MNKSYAKELRAELKALREGRIRIEKDPDVVPLTTVRGFVQVLLPIKTFDRLSKLAKRQKMPLTTYLDKVIAKQ